MFVIVFFSTIGIYGHLTEPPPYQPKYHTIAHHFLDLQCKYEPVPDECYKLLDHLITTVKSSVHYDPQITSPDQQAQQLLAIFNTIDSILTDNNFIFPAGDWTSTLGEALADHPLGSGELEAALAKPHNSRRASHMRDHAGENFHLMACEPAAFLYMGICQELGVDLKAVELPEHIFVRAQIDKTHWVNWDANRGRSIDDQEYIANWGVEAWQIRDNIYMHPLSLSETEAEMYTAIGCNLGQHTEFRGPGPAIDAMRRALALNPRNIYALSNLAGDLLFQPDPDPQTKDESLALAQAAEALQPKEGFIHQDLAFAYAAQGQTAAAVYEMKNAVDCDPDDPHKAYILPLIQAGETMWEVYRSANPFLFWIENDRGWLQLPIGIAAAGAGGIIFLLLRRSRAGNKLRPSRESRVESRTSGPPRSIETVIS